MRSYLMILGLFLLIAVPTYAQETATPTPTETPTATPTTTPEPYVYATLIPSAGDEPGQMTRFDYVVTVGDVMSAVLLVILILSLWSMFVFKLLSERDR